MLQLVLPLERLDRRGLGHAAEACAKVGKIGEAIKIALDNEQLTYEVKMHINAASLMNLIYRQ